MRLLGILFFACLGALCVWGANGGNPDNDIGLTLLCSAGFLTSLVCAYSLLPWGE